MARSDSEHLEKLLEIRDALTDAIIASGGNSPVRILIRNREVSYPDPHKALENINKLISTAERNVSITRGPARNVVRIKESL